MGWGGISLSPLCHIGNPKTATRSEIWATGLTIQQYLLGTFDSSVFKVILRSFNALPIFDNLVSRKRLVVERIGVKFGLRGQVFSAYKVPLTVVKCVFNVILMSFSAFVIFRNLVHVSRWLVVQQNGCKFMPRG